MTFFKLTGDFGVSSQFLQHLIISNPLEHYTY